MGLRTVVVLGAVLLANRVGGLAAQDTIVDDVAASVAPTRPASPAPASRPRTSAQGASQAAGALAPAAAGSLEALQQRMDRQDSAQRVHEDSLRRTIDRLSLKLPADSASRRRYEQAVSRVWWILGLWFALVLAYLVWAVHRYVYNYGLSNKEWKVLYPEVYARDGERGDFEKRRKDLINYRQELQSLALAQQVPGETLPQAPAVTQPFPEPQANPYEKDSFGLPPGTIRGILALTALVMFLVVESVSLSAPGSLENQFGGLVTAFQMVLAFYFGSRAVEVLQAKAGPAQPAQPAAELAAAPAAAPVYAAQPAAPQAGLPEAAAAAVAAPVEQASLPESRSLARFASIVATLRDEPAKPAPVAPVPAKEQGSLARRVLTLTASFETGRGYPACFGTVAGNFDNQGLSCGALQWNLGQGSLQPLWKEMQENHVNVLKDCLGALYGEFVSMLDGTKADQMRWALEKQYQVQNRTNAWRVVDNWKDALQKLGQSPEMIDVQVRRAGALYQAALALSGDYGLTTERGVALMFDIRVQNGSVDRGGAGQRIRDDFGVINPVLSDEEEQVERMRIIARRRSEAALPQWRGDVLARKMTIAEGTGTVHNHQYDLAKEFGIGLTPFAIAAAPVHAGSVQT